jgi:hypothetical protein
MQKENDTSIITEQFLLDRLGPAPPVSRVAHFLGESPTTTWRRLNEHQLQALKGGGTTRINLKSLSAFLNGSEDYKRTYKRGKKTGGRQPGVQARQRVAEKQKTATQEAK